MVEEVKEHNTTDVTNQESIDIIESEKLNEDNEQSDEVDVEVKEELSEQIKEDITEGIVEEVKIIDTTPWIFFDYSGTLVNTLEALSRAYTQFLGREFSIEQVKNLYKDYTRLSKFAIARKYKFNIFKVLFGGMKKLEEIRKEEFQNNVRVFPGIAEVLERMKKIVRAKIAIVTHETEIQDEYQREIIFNQFGLPNVFDSVISDVNNKQDKFDQFILENGIQYGILIGDLQFDLDLGEKYDFATIGVTWGFSTKDELKANYIISDPREILQVVMQISHQIEQTKLHGDPI